jgi:hypothetical protein
VTDFEPRALHLHSLDSLLADLISGRPVVIADGSQFTLDNVRTRSALNWYRAKRQTVWTAAVSAAVAEDLVNSTLRDAPTLPAMPARPANANARRITLRRLEAHRFAGLHKFGTPQEAPGNYVLDFTCPMTVLEGRNGSGKTSIANAIIWTLTGELFRPQREPEKATDEFECLVDAADGADDPSPHKLSPVTPMPDVETYRPDKNWVPADTWVELTFIDQTGAVLPTIRRSQSRSTTGKLTEAAPDLSVLGVDPVGLRIGTVMPGLLGLIEVGAESELGRAVSQLTGLSALADLADHAKRVKSKIEKDFTKDKTRELDNADRSYATARDDLNRDIEAHPGIKPPISVPACSADDTIEAALDTIAAHFENLKSSAFESAKDILGEAFDPADAKLRADLERNIGRALEYIGKPLNLPSAKRLFDLRSVSAEKLKEASELIAAIVAEGKELEALAKNPSAAARARLYARVATWITDHPDPGRDLDACVVCGGALRDAIDPVTGQPVKRHLHDAQADAALLSQTVKRWGDNALGLLSRSLHEALQRELPRDLPDHPSDLMRMAFLDELFAQDPFAGVLAALKPETTKAFGAAVASRSALADPKDVSVPKDCEELRTALQRVEKAIRFAEWRQANEALAKAIVVDVLGRQPKEDEPAEKRTLTGKLLDLDATVRGAKPISDALTLCGRLQAGLKIRRTIEKRLKEYGIVSAGMAPLLGLGVLADEQVNALRKTLRSEAAAWRTKVYLAAFPDTAHELVDASMGRKGELDLLVRTGGVSAPAQHVTNASALRASLVGFFLAFWHHVLEDRGGLATLLLDDPQELLDDENRERMATALAPLGQAGAQLVVTSYDARFTGYLVRAAKSTEVEHLEVHPATRLQPVVRTIPTRFAIHERMEEYNRDRNAEEPARNFADASRVYLESKLGDLFDDPAHSTWVKSNPHPTLASFVTRLRALVKAGPSGMYSAHVFRSFVDHPALADASALIQLMNKSHHGQRQQIRAADVAAVADDLAALLEMAEGMYDECYRWRRRDTVPEATNAPPPAIIPFEMPTLRVIVCPDLAAFTTSAPSGESQEAAEAFDASLLQSKALFYLRRPNFGFAAPVGAIAIVEAVPGPAADRRLVIARTNSQIYARRLVRSKDGTMLGLTAETPDPRTKSPKTILIRESDVAIHQVVGILFQSDVTVAPGADEAVLVEDTKRFASVEVTFRVTEDSAVPLALKGQIVLGGAKIELDKLGSHEDALVALSLDDGSSIFKRVGKALPGDLSHVRQFESIGGLGSSQVLSVGKAQAGLRRLEGARVIVGVLYHG